MKNKFRAIIISIVTASLLISIFIGCSSLKKEIKSKNDIKILTFVTADHPWADSIIPLLPEFEAQYNVKVEIQTTIEDNLTAKLTVPLTGEFETPDVFMYRPLQEGREFVENGWVEPLDKYVKDDKEYNLEDFSKGAIGTATIDNKLVGIPIVTEQEILYYRKDLLASAGLTVPKTIEELKADAQKLNNPENGIYGFIARGESSALVTQLSSYIYSEGGDFIKDNKAVLNTPESIKAIESYGALLKDYAPKEVTKWSWIQAMDLFAKGKVALYTDASSIYKNALDPNTSQIADKIGYAKFPSGDAGSNPYNVTAWLLGINSYSKNKDLAWEFIRWATSKEIVLKTQQKGNQGARMSVWNSSEGTSSFPKELSDVIKESSEGGVDHDRPTVINIGDARYAVGQTVQAVINDQDVKSAVEKANDTLQNIIDEEKNK